MKRAVGGVKQFANQSPAVLVARALRRALQADGPEASRGTRKAR